MAGAMAAKDATLVRNINVSELQRRLHEAGAITVLFGDVAPASSYFKAAQYFGTLGFFHNIEDVSG
ncbi:MAG: hypothetical protein H0T92_10590 [Pyrinomonadaceae bacterium]|nr:hypothetical protein [Pyrinomonadaceae bacterium]